MYLKKFIQLSSFITLTATSMSALAQTDSAHGSYVYKPTFKSVFVTKQDVSGRFGGAQNADAICQAEADAPNSLLKGKVFKAWVSGDLATDFSGSGRVFTRSSLPYRLVGGTMVAANFADLVDGQLLANIDVSADGSTRALSPAFPNSSQLTSDVWTGINSDGSNAGNCFNWANPGRIGGARMGSFLESDSKWTESSGAFCFTHAALYCFEQ